MDANKGEAERCLREAEKWQRQNRPVKALKFAKKSHRLFPTQAAQQKIGELTDLLQARGTSFESLNNNNNSFNAQRNYNQPPRNPPNNNFQNNSNYNRPPQPQPFVEIDPNSLNNNNDSMSFLSLEYWSLLLETIFGQIFGSIHNLFLPILPTVLKNFNLRYRRKVWWLLLVVIILLFTRYFIVKHPFGMEIYEQTPNRSEFKTGTEFDANYNENEMRNKYKSKSKYEREKEKYESKYNKKNKRNSNGNGNRKYRNDHRRYDDGYDDIYSHSNGRRSNRYGNREYYSGSGGGSWFNTYNIMFVLFVGSILMSMVRGNRNGNGNGGFNWNMLFLPMMFGGFPMGGFYGRFGGRRGMFGRRRRYF